MAKIIGLDLGAYSVKVVHLETRGKSFDVLDFIEVPLLKGSKEELRERQQSALRELQEAGHLTGNTVVTGLPADAAATRRLSFPYSDPRKIEDTLPFELEAEIPFDIEDVVISWQISGTSLGDDGQEMTDVLVAYARHDAVNDHLATLEEVGIDPRHVVFQAVALNDLYRHVLHDELSLDLLNSESMRTPGGTVVQFGEGAADPAVAIVDIGRRATNVAIMSEKGLVSAHTILHGGDDATRALARDLNLPLEEAERGKRKEAFIETATARAQFDQQQQVSDILKRAYAPIARRLRQTFQAALSESKVRTIKVVLSGGGSRIINLDRHFAEVLNTNVARASAIEQTLGQALPLHDGGEAPQAAMALAYAMSGVGDVKERTLLDFRQGEFGFRGDFDFIKDKAAIIGLWMLALLAILLVTSGVKAWGLSSEEDELRAEQKAACKSITGKDIDSTSQCLSIIQERIGQKTTTGIPDWSAADTFLEVSKRMPRDTVLIRKVTEMDVNSERVRLKVRTSDFDAVDKIVVALKKGKCFESVEKGKARNVEKGVEFPATIRLNCENQGEPEFDWVKKVPKAKIAKGKRPSSKKTALEKGAKNAKNPSKSNADKARALSEAALEKRKNAMSDTKAEASARAARRRALRDGTNVKEAVEKAREGIFKRPTLDKSRINLGDKLKKSEGK